MTDKVEVSAEDVQKMIAEAVAAALAKQPAKKAKGKPGKPKQTDEQKAAASAKAEAETIKNFKAAGYEDVQPRVNVKTYRKWVLEDRRQVKKGEKAVKCGNFPLFHINQTEPIVVPGTVH